MYPCVICVEECSEDAIQCSDCEKWVHIKCVPMSSELLVSWSDANLKFLCRDCCCTDDQFDHAKCLQRLTSVIGEKPRDIRIVTKSESLLLKTYGQEVLKACEISVDHPIDQVSNNILKRFHPVVLGDAYPAEVIGDGNCLYRAVARALTGSEAAHILLRVFTLLEILSFPMYYDSEHKKFVDLIQDTRVIIATYVQLAKDVGILGTYADIQHMYALSAALKLPIRSYFPPMLKSEYLFEPFSRKVCGRGVNRSQEPACTVMWTTCTEPQGPTYLPNHFVPLIMNMTTDIPNMITLDNDISSYDLSLIDDGEPIVPDTNTSSLECDAVSSPVHPLAHGGLTKGFMDGEDAIQLLKTFKYSEAHNTIPRGIKNDVFFFIKNEDNINNRQNGQRADFSDDCGAWQKGKGSCPKTYYMVSTDGRHKFVHRKGETWCTSKKVKGNKTLVPIEPQPEPDNIVELARYYTTLKRDSTYKRRVSWLEMGFKDRIALVEYCGTFPCLAPHGNSKQATEYMRTPASVMTEMSDLLKTDNPLNVYNEGLTKELIRNESNATVRRKRKR